MIQKKRYDVAIIGAGFSGTMVAVHLARLKPQLSIALIERNALAGPGLAYGTPDPDHLLNVRAGQMGAFADEPQHFWRWLEDQKLAGGASMRSFVPRRMFGDYLKHILNESCAADSNLALLHRRISTISRLPSGGFELAGNDGEMLTADRVVLALGNFPPDQLSDAGETLNPYAPATWQTLADDGDVLIVGTGLTSLDLVVSLAKTKPAGTLHLLSRHGLLPRVHIDTPVHALKLKPPYPVTALELIKAVRAEIAKASSIPWQSVIDALRPLNQQLWQGLSDEEQRRFLRHLRAYWDVHRHRCAPEVMDAYRALQQAGRVQLHRGSIVSQTAQGEDWEIVWRPRGKRSVENFTVRHVVRCTGTQSDFSRLGDALVQNLLEVGLIVPDRLRLGIAAAANYAICDATGNPVEGLYALGSLLKGRLYESVAVPELRQQAADVAEQIAQGVR